jgi:hypothetical protein
LKFQPKFSVSTSGKTSKADGASLDAKVTYPNTGQGTQADIARVKVELPKQLPSRLTTLQKACAAQQFNTNPAGCPAESKIGYAVVHTPVLPVPLEGPAIFVSHGGEAFPSLEIVLQGDGVTVDLVGATFISKAGVTSTTFKTVPDTPFSSFELTLPEGKYSALAANGSLCSQTLVMPTQFVAQNGGLLTQSTSVAVTGCGKPSIKITKAKVKANTVLVTVTTSQPGTVTVSGSGLKTTRETLAAGGAHQLKVSLTKSGRSARKRHRKTKVKAGVKDSNGSSSKTLILKL